MTTANLSIADRETVIQYTALPGQTVFGFDFPVRDAGELRVSIDQVITGSYTVTGIGNAGGGHITLATPATGGESVTLWLELPFQRLTGFQAGAATLLPTDLNDEFVRTIRLAQMLRRDLRRAIRLAIDDPLGGQDMLLPTAPSRAGRFLSFDAAGAPIAASGTGADAALRADLASALAGLGADLVAIPRTPAEILAGVVPEDPRWLELDVRRYGAVSGNDGAHMAGNTVAFQAAIDVANVAGEHTGGWGGGEVRVPPGWFRLDTLQWRIGVIIRGAGHRGTILDFSGATDAGHGLHASGGGANYMHGAGLFDLQVREAPGHGIFVDTDTGFGENAFIDRVLVYNCGGDGLRFAAGNSTPLHLGRVSTHNNGGAGLRCISENVTHIQVVYLAGDNNAESLMTVENLGPHTSVHVIGWKSERTSSDDQDPGHPNIFVFKDAFGGFVRIGSGRYTAFAPGHPPGNAVVRVDAASGGSLNLVVDPLCADVTENLDEDYTYGIDNVITGRTTTPAFLMRRPYSATRGTMYDRTAADQPISVYQTAAHSLALLASEGRVRFGHPDDGVPVDNVSVYEMWSQNVRALRVQSNGLLMAGWFIQMFQGRIWATDVGTPEGNVEAPVGSLYTRQDGGAGTTLYVKESGTGNTGWVAK